MAHEGGAPIWVAPIGLRLRHATRPCLLTTAPRARASGRVEARAHTELSWGFSFLHRIELRLLGGVSTSHVTDVRTGVRILGAYVWRVRALHAMARNVKRLIKIKRFLCFRLYPPPAGPVAGPPAVACACSVLEASSRHPVTVCVSDTLSPYTHFGHGRVGVAPTRRHRHSSRLGLEHVPLIGALARGLTHSALLVVEGHFQRAQHTLLMREEPWVRQLAARVEALDA